MANNPKVLIAGAGPVGLTLANELARRGVPVRIVDKAAQRTDKSKALVLWSRTLELLDDAGYAKEFLPAGFPAPASLVGHVEGRGVLVMGGGASGGAATSDAAPAGSTAVRHDERGERCDRADVWSGHGPYLSAGLSIDDRDR